MIECNQFTGITLLATGLTNISFDRITLLSIIVILLLAINVVVIVALLLYLRKAKRPLFSTGGLINADTRLEDRTFAALSEQATEISRNIIQLSSLVTSAGMRMTEFHRGFEQFAFGHWETHKQLQEKCQQLIRGLIVCRDRMEQLQMGRVPPEKVATLAETCIVEAGEALSQVGIVEIPVQNGQSMDSSIHSIVGMRNNEYPKGTILEVVRRGYAVTGERGELIPTRLAEVIISSGPAKQEAAVEEVNTHPTDSVVEEKQQLHAKITTASSEHCEEKNVKHGTLLVQQNKKQHKDNKREDTKP